MSSGISVVIPNWNGGELLLRCLESLALQSIPPAELIVVDNGSDDGSADRAARRFPDCTILVNQENRGYAAACNQGARASRGELVLLLNFDTELDPGCLSGLLSAAEGLQPPWLGLFPKVVFADAERLINAFGAAWYSRLGWRDHRVGLPDLGQFSAPEQVFGSIFPAVLLQREEFLRSGGLEEGFFSYAEDFEFCYRAGALGQRFFTAPQAVVRHHYRATAALSGRRREFLHARNVLWLLLKNYQLSSLLLRGPRLVRRFVLEPIRRGLAAGEPGVLLSSICGCCSRCSTTRQTFFRVAGRCSWSGRWMIAGSGWRARWKSSTPSLSMTGRSFLCFPFAQQSTRIPSMRSMVRDTGCGEEQWPASW
jgi:GT2 family glycosyltransferase